MGGVCVSANLAGQFFRFLSLVLSQFLAAFLCVVYSHLLVQREMCPKKNLKAITIV